MDLSIFLAKLFGLYLMITSLLIFTRRDAFSEVIEDFYRSPALILFSAFFNLIIGLLIVLSHNVWTWDWRVLITLIGYMSLAKGIIHFYRPGWLQALAEKMAAGNGYTILAIINLIIGLTLTYIGMAA